MKKTKSAHRFVALFAMLALLVGMFTWVEMPVLAAESLTDDTTETMLQDTDGDDYYEIGTAAELRAFANLVNAGSSSINAELTANIDLQNEEWTPIGTDTSAPFSGIFNGAGYTVSGLSITTIVEYVGLFGYVKTGGIRDLHVSGNISKSTMPDTHNKIGLIAGRMLDSGFYNCRADGSISINSTSVYGYIGGMIGVANHCVIINCAADVNITVSFDGTVNYASVGGIVGVATVDNTVPQCILNSYAVGDITVSGNLSSSPGANYCVGGIAGYLKDDAVNNYYYGTITDTDAQTAKKSAICLATQSLNIPPPARITARERFMWRTTIIPKGRRPSERFPTVGMIPLPGAWRCPRRLPPPLPDQQALWWIR
ncbi:MAG: hypothetical protein IJX39_03555 [Clostridia bacterium]|nr:hypothetical protein [Clostridia bacterium]